MNIKSFIAGVAIGVIVIGVVWLYTNNFKEKESDLKTQYVKRERKFFRNCR